MLNDPETVSVLKEQVQECLKHVRSLNEKLASGKYAPDSPELKQGVDALRAILSAPSPKKKAVAAGAETPAPKSGSQAPRAAFAVPETVLSAPVSLLPSSSTQYVAAVPALTNAQTALGSADVPHALLVAVVA